MALRPNIFGAVDNPKASRHEAEFDFYQAVEQEATLVQGRRLFWVKRWGVRDPAPWGIDVLPMIDKDGKRILDERGRRVPEMRSERAITGLALSGGGVRSAAFGLGVLQGLDAVVPDNNQPQVLQAIDYLSTVSGGGYIGASMAAGLFSGNGNFPFESKLDGWETDGTQHLRDYSNYLVPRGLMDWVVGAVVLTRGLLINALLVLGFVFVASAVTARINPTVDRLGAYHVPWLGPVPVPFLWSVAAFMLYIVVQLPPVATLFKLSPSAATDLDARERVENRLAVLLLGCIAVLVLDAQAFFLRGMFDAFQMAPCHAPEGSEQIQACVAAKQQAGWLGHALAHVGLGSGAPWRSVGAAVAGLGMFGEKLVKVARATIGDRSKTGLTKHWLSRIAIGLGSLVVPLAIWMTYLSASFAAIGCATKQTGTAGTCPTPILTMPYWLDWIGPAHLWVAYAIIGIGFLIFCCSLQANANSLHGYYRDRLSRAFLGHRAEYEKKNDPEAMPPQPTSFDPDTLMLSSMAGQAADGASGLPLNVEASPFLLVNAAVNLEASAYTNRRGRNADSFTFSPRHCGSSATGYAATGTLEKADPRFNLATAMAISGAAASANMGSSTIRPLTFSLAVLNVRLGYWFPNPARLAETGRVPGNWQTLWPAAFLLEAFGLLDEDRPLIYLSDGGHFDNLGIYELLKRGCRAIVASDAEADPSMNFGALVHLERCARIDLGVRIDLPWEELRRWSSGITVEAPHGSDDRTSACNGPHVALGRIDYGHGEPGVLIYIKACITGDENDLVRDYRRRNPDFLHETTLDQFFTEEQFEVYRALGFHETFSFFEGKDRFGLHPADTDRAWLGQVRRALRRINVPEDKIDSIALRQDTTPPRAA